MIAFGAGAASRQSLGTALFGGYLIATFLSLFVVPVLYIIVKSISDRALPPNKDRQAQMRELSDLNTQR